jgi:hypothetical protein
MAYYRINMKQKWAEPVWESCKERLDALINGTMTIPELTSSGLNTAWNTNSTMPSMFGMDDPINWNVSSDWEGVYGAERL